MYTSLYSDYPWQTPDPKSTGEVQTPTLSESQSTFYSGPRPRMNHYVYRFGLADSFKGVISTIPGFKTFGQEIQLVMADEEHYDMTFRDVLSPLKCYDTELKWYNQVVKDNIVREFYWTVARPQYNPVSNVLRLPESGVTIREGELDDAFAKAYFDSKDSEVPRTKNVQHDSKITVKYDLGESSAEESSDQSGNEDEDEEGSQDGEDDGEEEGEEEDEEEELDSEELEVIKAEKEYEKRKIQPKQPSSAPPVPKPRNPVVKKSADEKVTASPISMEWALGT